MAKKSSTTAKTIIKAADKAKIIDKIEQDIPLTAAEIKVIAPTATTQATPSFTQKVAAPTPTPTPTLAEDPYYKIDPATGKSPAQLEAEKAVVEAAAGTYTAEGLAAGLALDKAKAEAEAKAKADAEARAKVEAETKAAIGGAESGTIGAIRSGLGLSPETGAGGNIAVPVSGAESGTIGAIRTEAGKSPEAEPTPMGQPAVSGAESGTIGGIRLGLGNKPEAEPTPMGQPAVSGAESGTIGGIRLGLGLSPETGAEGGTGGAGGAGTGGAGTGGAGTGGTGTGGATGAGGAVQTYTAPDGKIFTDINAYNAYLEELKAAEKTSRGKSAYDLLFEEFSRYGLGALVTPLKDLITKGLSPAEFTLALRETPAYQIRFAANKQRINKGLSALSEAEYIGLEDQYQNIMRNYGLPASYYEETIDPVTGVKTQVGFQKFIAGDVSPTELEDRISTAQNRIIYANPEVSIALKNFYPDISNGDLLAYALDPEKALAQIKRRITAAEVGASAVQLGLTTNVTDAEYLARYGVTKEQAQQGYRNVAEVLPRASFLGDIYGKQGMGPYTQQTAEREVFNVPGAAEAAAQRRKLSELETAQFSGRAGVGALARERAGGF